MAQAVVVTSARKAEQYRLFRDHDLGLITHDWRVDGKTQIRCPECFNVFLGQVALRQLYRAGQLSSDEKLSILGLVLGQRWHHFKVFIRWLLLSPPDGTWPRFGITAILICRQCRSIACVRR